jgi:uncharacterized protein (DUF2336 family)
MFSWVLGNRDKKKKKSGKKRPSYDEAKRLAKSGNATERRDLAAHEDLEPELLYFLAEDEDTDVRVEIARNDGTPLQADKLLARDPEAEVRRELAYKIGRLIPTLTDEENVQLTEMAMQVLEVLADDELPDVRAIISNEIKSLDNIPKKLVKKLAHDLDDIVSAPILEYSPLLNEQELVQIIAGGIQGRALTAVARRQGIGDAVSEAIADTKSEPGITQLLKNHTAKISEKTMAVIGMAAKNTPTMHRPLVERSNLSTNTIKRIATFVSAALVENLIKRHRLDDDIAHDIRQSVRERIINGDPTATDADEELPDERARRLFDSEELTEQALQKAIEEHDITLIPPALSLLSKIDLDIVKRILMGDSGKAVTALVWKAGLNMETAEMVQLRVANVPAKSVIRDTRAGNYSMSADDLEWYLAYFLD